MELRKIVVGIDFSAGSEGAARHAIDLARHTGAEIVLVHAGAVVDAAWAEGAEGGVAEWEHGLRARLVEDRQQLTALRDRLSGQGVEVSTTVIDGHADTALVEAARELGAELIVTGSHGRTGLQRFLIGSVAERVVRLAEAAVLVVRPGGRTDGGYRHILVPTDFSPHAHAAVELALVLAAPGAAIDLVHFWQLPIVAGAYCEPMPAAEAALGTARQQMLAAARKQGEALVERHRREGVTLRFEAIEGSAAHGIVDRVKDSPTRPDVIIMGSHGRRGFRRWILGSVAERTVHHAPCSVLVVHQAVEPER